MNRLTQRLIQVAFLGIFLVLALLGRPQVWVGIFLLGVLLSFVFSRLYCGWACPINTAMIGVSWLKKKLQLKSFNIPEFLKKPWMRYFALLLFVGIFAFSTVSGRKLPVLPAVVVLGVLLTFFFPEALWHRYLCPFGTILQFPARFSKHKMQVDPEKCNNCTICSRVCPAVAVTRDEQSHQILKADCLVCLNCQRSCPKQAISYK